MRCKQIGVVPGTDVNAMRPTMKSLIAENKIKARGERRGMQYFAA
jgi:hypothetical protein